jgi:hypothetical protein
MAGSTALHKLHVQNWLMQFKKWPADCRLDLVWREESGRRCWTVEDNSRQSWRGDMSNTGSCCLKTSPLTADCRLRFGLAGGERQAVSGGAGLHH